jgi:hypothetical protein
MICVFLISIETNRKVAVQRDGLSLSLLGFASFLSFHPLKLVWIQGDSSHISFLLYFPRPGTDMYLTLDFAPRSKTLRHKISVHGCPPAPVPHHIHGNCEPPVHRNSSSLIALLYYLHPLAVVPYRHTWIMIKEKGAVDSSHARTQP